MNELLIVSLKAYKICSGLINILFIIGLGLGSIDFLQNIWSSQSPITMLKQLYNSHSNTKRYKIDGDIKNMINKYNKNTLILLVVQILVTISIFPVFATLIFLLNKFILNDMMQVLLTKYSTIEILKISTVSKADNYIFIVYIIIFLVYIVIFKFYAPKNKVINPIIYKLCIVSFAFYMLFFSTNFILKFVISSNIKFVFIYILLLSVVNITSLIFYFFKYAIVFKKRKLISYFGFLLIILTDLYILFLFGLNKLSMDKKLLIDIKVMDWISAIPHIIYFGASSVFTFPKLLINDTLIPFYVYLIWYFFNLVIIGVLVAYFREFIKPHPKFDNSQKCGSVKDVDENITNQNQNISV